MASGSSHTPDSSSPLLTALARRGVLKIWLYAEAPIFQLPSETPSRTALAPSLRRLSRVDIQPNRALAGDIVAQSRTGMAPGPPAFASVLLLPGSESISAAVRPAAVPKVRLLTNEGEVPVAAARGGGVQGAPLRY
jgi:hypothetical protein